MNLLKNMKPPLKTIIESMAEDTKMEHRKSKFLFWIELIGSLIVIGSVLFSAGKLSEVVTDNKDSQREIIKEVAITSKEVAEIKANQRVMIATDSTNLKIANGILSRIEKCETRMSRVEWRLKLPPIELENLPSTSKQSKTKPLSQSTITIKEK